MWQAIFGTLDKSLGLALNFAEDRPNLDQRELNKLYELRKELISRKNLPKAQWDFEVMANMIGEIDSEMDRVREVAGV